MALASIALALALFHADVLDFESGSVLRDMTVLIQEGRIAEISRGGAIPPDAEVLDLRGRTLVPGGPGN
jgi:imidazolonepropionase-like amidohydrolase